MIFSKLAFTSPEAQLGRRFPKNVNENTNCFGSIEKLSELVTSKVIFTCWQEHPIGKRFFKKRPSFFELKAIIFSWWFQVLFVCAMVFLRKKHCGDNFIKKWFFSHFSSKTFFHGFLKFDFHMTKTIF